MNFVEHWDSMMAGIPYKKITFQETYDVFYEDTQE